MSYQRFKTFDLTSAKTGLATVTVQPYDSDNTPIGSPTAMIEMDAGQGVYGALVTIPSGHVGTLRYTSGEVFPIIKREEINPAQDEIFDALNTYNEPFSQLLDIAAAVGLGILDESVDRTRSTLYAVGDSGRAAALGTTVQSATETTVTRTPTVN